MEGEKKMKNHVEVVETEKGFITKGLNKNIAINLHLPAPLAKNILTIVSKKLTEESIKINDYERDVTTCPLFLKDNGSFFLIIFPDSLIRFPWERNCSPLYKSQI